MNEEKACQVEHNHSDSYCECSETTGDSHGHGCSGHHHGMAFQDTSGSRLLTTLALNLFIPAAQVIGGLLANSVALISDAVHNFSDFTALLISYIAFRIGRKGATAFNNLWLPSSRNHGRPDQCAAVGRGFRDYSLSCC